MTTAAIVTAALAAFPAPACDQRTLHYGVEADAAITAMHGPEVGGMGGGSRPCELWVRTGMSRRVTVRIAFHEAAHVAGHEHGPAMDRAVNRAVKRYYHPILNRRASAGQITGGILRARFEDGA